MKKRKLIYNLIFLIIFFCIFVFPNEVQALTITTETDGSSNATSDIFSLVDESGGNLSTNSHYEFLDFWYDNNGKFNILWKGDKQAASKKAVSLTIAGISIEEIYEYTTSFTITQNDGTETQYTTSNGGRYYLATFETTVDFSETFEINLNVGSGGFNVNASAKVQFYILVEDNVDGTTSIDWSQSRGNITVGSVYKINANSYSKKKYVYYDVTTPDSITTRSDEKFVNVTGAEGVTSVMFYYLSESETRDITVQKIWDDQDNVYGKRPQKIRFVLTSNDIETDTYYDLNINSGENSYTFTGLSRFDANDNEIQYGIIEKEVNSGDLSNYNSSISGNMDDGFQVTNTVIPSYINTLKITKQSSEKIYSLEQYINYEINMEFEIASEYTEDVTIEIIDTLPCEIDTSKEYELNGGIYNSSDKTITWKGIYSIADNLIIWDDGTEEVIDITTQKITKEFSIYYKDIVNYEDTTITNNVIGIVTLTNGETQSAKAEFNTDVEFNVDIVITKNWEDDGSQDENRDEITIKLYDGNNNLLQEIILNNDNNWTVTIEDLPKYDENYMEIQYTVVEDEVPIGYISTIEKVIEENIINFNITNKSAIIFPETGGIR